MLNSVFIFAQSTNSSPYSFFGIGEQAKLKSVEESSMGQIGGALNSGLDELSDDELADKIIEYSKMLEGPVIILIGVFLFFQSGVEGISNSWTTTYIRDVVDAEKEQALFALSALVLSLTLTRIVLGYILRKISSATIQFISICLAATGAFVLMFFSTYGLTMLGLVLLGAGLASGFPVFLGYVGELYKEMSGTAFSFVMVIALIGNMIINYLMGVIAQVAGMKHFPSLLLCCLAIMLIVLYFVVKQLRLKIKI